MVNIKEIKQGLILGIIGFGISACEVSDPDIREYSYEATTSLKWISPDITDPRDSQSFNQKQYSISTNSRLLIKSDELTAKTQGIRIDDKFIMALTIYVDRDNMSAEEIASIKLCPLAKNWMMMATWKDAHPFKEGSWSQKGGDYSESACISVSAYNQEDDIIRPPTKTDPPTNENTKINKTEKQKSWDVAKERSLYLQSAMSDNTKIRIQFNISDWFLEGPHSGVLNTGFILISETSFDVGGTQSGISPVISWSEPYRTHR